MPVGHAQTRFDEDGRLNDPNLVEEIQAVVDALLAEVEPAERLAA